MALDIHTGAVYQNTTSNQLERYGIIIDDHLSITSENAVQNKVITNEINVIKSKQEEDGAKLDSLDKEMGEVKTHLTREGAIIELEIGDSEEIKSRNLEKLKKVNQTFIADINYGYGSADWLPTTGGTAFIETADGHNIYYIIETDGSVIKYEDYLKPEEPFIIAITENEITNASAELIAKCNKASIIRIVDGTTYVDYFYSETLLGRIFRATAQVKDDSISQDIIIVTEDSITKSTSRIIIGAATKTSLGLVKAGINIADVSDSSTLVGAFNTLLGQLRNCGILIS